MHEERVQIVENVGNQDQKNKAEAGIKNRNEKFPGEVAVEDFHRGESFRDSVRATVRIST